MTPSKIPYSQALEELQRLRDQGAISAEEFDQKKASILDRIVDSAGSYNAPSPKAVFDAATPRLLRKDNKFGPPERPYRVERVLGQGSFGVVYQAEDVKDSEPGKPAWVALKALNREVAADDLAASQVKQEARRVSQLTHENIVRVHGWAEDPVGGPPPTPFMVMEYLEGETLAKWLARRRDGGLGSVPLSEALALLKPVASALDYAASKRVIHRDIKPNNIFLAKTVEGVTVKVLDFGLAATLRDSGSTGSSNGRQLSSGANGYRPPEWNARRKEWKASYDVYSLAVLLYQLLDAEHQLPYAEHQPEAMPDPPDGLNEAQWKVLQRGLAYSADQRIGSAVELLRQLEAQMVMLQPVPDLSDDPADVTLQPGGESITSATTKVAESTEVAPKPEKPKRHMEKILVAIGIVVALSVAYFDVHGRFSDGPPAPSLVPPLAQASSATPVAAGTATLEAERKALVEKQAQEESARRRTVAATALEPVAGTTIKDCGECPEMVAIPAGSFGMGSTHDSTEKPVHTVALSEFLLGKTEVTQAQWRAVMGNNPSRFACDDCPVEWVSWDEIQVYLKKLNAKTGKRFRLPSEAEWEYACRAGTTNTYCGDSKIDAVAWYHGNSGGKTRQVGQKQANAFGLHDMGGNVSEWVQDCWRRNYNGAPTDGNAWGGRTCEWRVRRGGSWNYSQEGVRSTSRQFLGPDLRDLDVGFRVALSPSVRTLP